MLKIVSIVNKPPEQLIPESLLKKCSFSRINLMNFFRFTSYIFKFSLFSGPKLPLI
jgi:hypothetical protein